MEIIESIAPHQARRPNIVGQRGFVSLVRSFVLLVRVPVFMINPPGVSESQRGDADKRGIQAERQRPAEFRTLKQQAVLAKKAAERHLGIHEIPAVQVLVVQLAEARKVLSALQLKSAGNVDDFPEGLFQLAVPIAIGILEKQIVGETLDVFRAQ